ncbi:MAG: hypothetical protein OXI96_08645 [Acidimicrobiaceae bacterium]|nr:hypothetical protein [Acidimicrobiaceae bacterium]
MGKLGFVSGSDGTSEILLQVKAQVSQTRLMRAGIAAVVRQRISEREVDELCCVVDEALTMLLACPAVEDVWLKTRFLLSSDHFQIEISRSDEAEMPSEEVDKFKQTTASASVAVSVKPQQSWVSLTKQA